MKKTYCLPPREYGTAQAPPVGRGESDSPMIQRRLHGTMPYDRMFSSIGCWLICSTLGLPPSVQGQPPTPTAAGAEEGLPNALLSGDFGWRVGQPLLAVASDRLPAGGEHPWLSIKDQRGDYGQIPWRLGLLELVGE